MFDRLRRAKSFIHRSKREEERQKYDDLEFSETSHLKRSVVIDSETLREQRNLRKTNDKETKSKIPSLTRQVSRSQEELHDQVVEQLKRISFKDSSNASGAFERRNPAYMSERIYHRRSIGSEDSARNPQKQGRNEKIVRRVSGDVLSNFDRKSPVYHSERVSGGKEVAIKNERVLNQRVINEKSLRRLSGDDLSNLGKNPTYQSDSALKVNGTAANCDKRVLNQTKVDENIVCRVNGDVLSKFDRNHLAYKSERALGRRESTRNHQKGASNQIHIVPDNSAQEITAYRSEKVPQNNVKTNIQTIEQDALSNFDRKNPPFWSERSIQIIKQKCSEKPDYSTHVFASDDDFLLNRKTVDLSYNFDRRNPAYVSDRSRKKDILEKTGLKNLFQKVKGTQKQQRDQKDWYDSGISGGSTCSSVASGSMERTDPVKYFEEANSRSKEVAAAKEVQSRKRHHDMTKANLDKSKPVYWSADSLVRESRKKAYDRSMREDDESDDN